MTVSSSQSLVLLALVGIFSACADKKVDFASEIKPILNKHCITCHGGVKQNGGFSVLFRNEALDTTESGKYAIVPGHPDQSEMIRRLTASDPEERMPYKKDPLTNDEIQTLKKWIEEGAEWGEHWAYKTPEPVEVPKSKKLLSGIGTSDEEWASTDIDYFILQRLNEHKLKPSPIADRATLIRRIYLDLIGIPPTFEAANNFINDTSPDAYEKVVDQLLKSPQYGEKWASWWLDLARYADTKGYERDVYRNMWRYRDWVIKAFNEDKAFNQFTIEQLAGDMLESPTDDQLIATGFHRNTMNNDEGGTEDEEFRVASLIDRVGTTWEVWQGTTMACVQCHSHPYDPIHHEEYYKSMAIFNNTRDEDTEGEHPNLRFYSAEDDKKVQEIRDWVLKVSGNEKAFEVNRFLKTLEPKYHPHDFDEFQNGELLDTKWLGVRSGGSARMKQIPLDGKKFLYINYWADANGGKFEIRLDKISGEKLAVASVPKTSGRKTIRIPLTPTTGKHDLYFVFSNRDIKPTDAVCGIEWFAFRDALPGENNSAYWSVDKSFDQLLNAKVDNTPVTIENISAQKRSTHIFDRGNWMVKGKEVQPGVPLSLTDNKNIPISNRLAFAQWLVSGENPLTSRVIANRIWEQVFGYGLIETLEDFGSQGAPASHPELLDWLALRIMNDNEWSMKKTLKDIVMSSVYRQDSRMTKDALTLDQQNRFLSHAPRTRLSSEQVRDQALFVSGLLSDKMYGPSVMPYQPKGIWQSVWSGAYWKQSEGEDQHRRGVYTFVKRTSPYPSMMMFDGSSREVCVGRRIRTNTPLQALVTLNDSVFVEASIHFAKRMMSDSKSIDDRVNKGYSLLTFKPMSAAKKNVFKKLYDEALVEYENDKDSAGQLLGSKQPDTDLAAMVVVANAMLNLDEVLMKE
jgi:hypothetical protein